MDHPAFAEAGSVPGIEIWIIENFEPVAYETKKYGKFYNGDSYIVLKTTGTLNSSLSYDAHFWLGSKTTQDKKGAAAIWTVTLDDMLGGRAVHHREVQGHESSLFLGYFKPAIRYLEGGNESGFTEVETNAGAEKRLLKLSGCENMRIEEVPAESSSLTRDHCFILEVDHDIFVLMPEGAKATQRRKIISVANSLRDDYHNGRATIEIIDEFSSDDDVAAFFEALGSGSMEDLLDGESVESFTRDETTVYLYKLLTGDEVDLVPMSKPYKQKNLASDEVYILDTPCSGIYVWLGQEVDSEVKKSYADFAQIYLDLKGYPAWVNVTKIVQGAESFNFKQYFHNWDTISSAAAYKGLITETDMGYHSGDVDESSAVAKLIGKSAVARSYMPDQGDGNLTVIRVSGDQEDVTEVFETSPVMYQSEVYVVKYLYKNDNGNEVHVVYWWIGANATDDDKKYAVDLVTELEDELEDRVTVVKVPQGKEPKHFLSIFKGRLTILYGSKEDEYKAVNSNKTYDDDNIRLFRVEGTESGVDMRMVQVSETAEVLQDDDVFVLETMNAVFVRNGKESDAQENEAALTLLSSLIGDEKEVIVLEQGEEPEEFWEALGGQPEDKEGTSGWKLTVSRRVNSPPELAAVAVSVTGKIKFEDLSSEYTQQDLSDDGIYILDTGEELYLWQGKNTPERVKIARAEIVKAYIKDDGLERTVDSALVISVGQGNEPAAFKKLFQQWDDDMWDNQASYEDIKNDAIAANSN